MPDPFRAHPRAVELYRYACLDPSWTLELAALRLGLSQADTAEAVESLVALGLLSPWESTPSKYIVVDADAAFARLLALEDQRFRAYLDDFEETRGALRLLISDYRSDRAQHRNHLEIEMLVSRAQIDAALNDLAFLARHQICVIHPGPVPGPQLMQGMLERDRVAIGSGVAVRSIFLQRLAETPHVAEVLRELVIDGAKIRTAAHLPLRMLLYDENAAVLPIDPEHTEAGAMLIRGAALLGSLRAFFENCWINAVPFTATASAERANDDEYGFTRQQMAALQMMAAGTKDEVIARRLGMSPRTLSRTVADVMTRLGVSSRFEAGARLSKMGLLDAPTHSGSEDRTAGTDLSPDHASASAELA